MHSRYGCKDYASSPFRALPSGDGRFRGCRGEAFPKGGERHLLRVPPQNPAGDAGRTTGAGPARAASADDARSTRPTGRRRGRSISGRRLRIRQDGAALAGRPRTD